MPKQWIDEELAGCRLGDGRLGKRLHKIIRRMSGMMGKSIPLACQDWANTKAAYRFLSNDRVSEEEILRGHFEATKKRFAASDGPTLVLHDTTEFSYKRKDAQAVGFTNRVNSGKDKDGRDRFHTVCGVLGHSSLAVTASGLPLGLTAAKFWTRKKFKGAAALNRKSSLTRVPIEQRESNRWLENVRQSTELFGDPGRCIHIGDRESDIWEVFCLTQELGTHFLIRARVDRLVGDGSHKISDTMAEVKVKGTHQVIVRDAKGNLAPAQVDVSWRRIQVCPPVSKKKQYPNLHLTVIHAREHQEPSDRPRIDWKLITDLPVHSHADAVNKLQCYAMRWKIEVFHKILKSGCQVERSRLRTAERLVKLIALFCILSWRIFWLTMLNRTEPDLDPGLVLTRLEMKVLDHLAPKKQRAPPAPETLSAYLVKIARLGGYLARNSDPPPGNTVMWRGLSRLNDITLGATLQAKGCG